MADNEKIVLEKSGEVMIRRNQRLVLGFFQPNNYLCPERFAYHFLLLF